MTFVDLTKVFDTISREGLWKIMAEFGCPAKFIAMVRQFHEGMLARVQNDGQFSDHFPVTNGVKQGRVLASTLFSMMFSAMFTDAFQDGYNGIPIRYRFDGKLFNLRRLQAKSKVQTEMLVRSSLLMVWQRVFQQKRKCKKVWTKYLIHVTAIISIKKTEVVYPSAPGNPYMETTITVKGQRLQVVDRFTNLEAHCPELCTLMMKSMPGLPKLVQHFCLLCESIWDRSRIRLDTKLKVYRSVVLPTLLNACETWTVYQRRAKSLTHSHTSCLRKLLKIKWQDRIPDTEVLRRAGMQSVHTLLKLAHLKWTGHVSIMPGECLPKKNLYWRTASGKTPPWWSEEAIQGHSQSLL